VSTTLRARETHSKDAESEHPLEVAKSAPEFDRTALVGKVADPRADQMFHENLCHQVTGIAVLGAGARE
jgi:hypothetical protein